MSRSLTHARTQTLKTRHAILVVVVCSLSLLAPSVFCVQEVQKWKHSTGSGSICPGLNSDWKNKNPSACRHTSNRHTHTVLTQVFNPYRCCWCCYGLLWCWSDPSPNTNTHWQTSTHTHPPSQNTVLNCLNPFFVFYSFFLVHFFLPFVAYCIDKSYYRFTHQHLSIPLLLKNFYPMRNEKCTLLLLYHTNCTIEY